MNWLAVAVAAAAMKKRNFMPKVYMQMLVGGAGPRKMDFVWILAAALYQWQHVHSGYQMPYNFDQINRGRVAGPDLLI